ncbi:hypothetical protein BX666DRAFT_1506620 [Dichotomocladium elegans]|nr:hypothetical protein BX666DRAFT_1506620 [Dichotomocladium elegans]
MRMTDNINKIFMLAEEEKANDWIATTAKILKDALGARKLNLQVEYWSPAFSEALSKVGKQVQEHGISFHPTEFALLKPEAQPHFTFGSDSYKSREPTLQHHYKLNPAAMEANLANRRKVFDDILKAQASSPTHPTTDSPFSAERSRTSTPLYNPMAPAPPRPPMRAPPSSNLFINSRPGPGGRSSMLTPASSGAAPTTAGLFNTTTSRYPQPHPQRAAGPPSAAVPAGASSLFIRSNRKNSLSRPPLQRANISVDDNGASNTVSTAMPKGFQRPQRTQMLDFSEQSTLEKNNMKNIDAANQSKYLIIMIGPSSQTRGCLELQAEKEARKERLLEQRRLTAEKRRLDQERKQRPRERKQQVPPTTPPPPPPVSPASDLESVAKRRRVRAEGAADSA